VPPATARSVATGVTLVSGDTIRLEPVAWLWDGWLARGKVHVLAGAPGTGKTTLALALAATLATGGRWPDGTRAGVGSVVIWSGEDDPRDTLAPRLVAAGADMRRVQFVASMTDKDGPRPFDPATDAEALADALAGMDPPAGLLIVDPIVAAVAGDSHKNAEVRRALQPLVDLAMTRRCAVLGITHLTKGTQGREPTERVTGSLAFGALARVVMATAKLPDEDGGGRVLVRAKSNLGADTGGYRYDLEALDLPGHPGIITTRVLWGEVLDGTARELLGRAEAQGDPDERGALEDAKGFLRAVLADGPLSAKQIKREADEAGHSQITLKRAKAALGVEAIKDGFRAGWTWALPPKGIATVEGDHDSGVRDLAPADDPLPGACGEVDHGSPEPSHHENMIPFMGVDPLRAGRADPDGASPSPVPGDIRPTLPGTPAVVEVDL
jgi:putative DNA primase/helicase